VLGFEIWSTDVTQADLHAESDLQRDVVIQPDILQLYQNELVQFIKPFYGISDAWDYWAETLVRHHPRELRMSQATADFSLFFKSVAGELISLSGIHVDDLLQAGTPAFRQDTLTRTGASFDVKSPAEIPLTYTGIEITRTKTGAIITQQGRYIATILKLAHTTTWEQFRYERQNLAWICHTRPDIAYAVSFAQQVTETSVSMETLKTFNRVILYLQRTPEISLKYPPLDHTSLRLVVCADANFKNC
jgi:hypothetical protein